MRRLIVVGLVAASCLAMAPAASATTLWWRYGALGAGHRDASASYNGFRASGAIAEAANKKMRAGAHYPGGWTLYANFAEAWDYVCHSYAGDRELGALIENPHTVTQNPVSALLRYPSWETAC